MTEEIPGYRILERAGEGGFSVVYRARQDSLDREVALKVLSISAVDGQALHRFQRESKITGRLSGHPNVVTVLDTGTTGSGRPYIVMEYFGRGSLADRLAAEGPLPVADVLRIGVKMAAALAATHEIDVLHRDVKPQNILVSRYGEPALADFGIARLVDPDTGQTPTFTPQHVAPEILEGLPPSPAADVYSLGSTLHQLLAGRPPFAGPAGEGLAPLILRILHEPPPVPRADVPPRVLEVILRAMAKDPARRPASAVEFARELQAAQSALGLPVTDLAYAGAGVPGPPRAEPAPVPWGPVALDAAVPPPSALVPGGPGGAPAPPYDARAEGSRARDGRTRDLRAPGGPARGAPADGAPYGASPDFAAQPYAPYGGVRVEVGSRDGTTVRARGGRRRRGPAVAAVAAVLGVAGLSAAAVALSGGHGKGGGIPKSAGTTRRPASRDRPSFTPAEIGAARPHAVTAAKVPGGTAVRLRWRLGPGNTYPLFVRRDGAGAPEELPYGTTTTLITGLRPGTRHCFTVGAVLNLDPPVYARAKPVCAG